MQKWLELEYDNQMTERGFPQLPATGHQKTPWQAKVAALAEVTGVLAGGNILAILISRALGIARYRDLVADIPEGVQPDFFNLALISGAELLLKYAILFGMAYAIGRWHRRRPLRAYGVARGTYSLPSLVALGLVAGLMVNFFPDLIYFIDLSLNGRSDLIVTDLSYQGTPGFWVLEAVAGFVLVPILEELFHRGYYQTRLAEDLGAGTAIWIMAFMFAFSHTRFIQADVFNLATLASLVLTAAVFGYLIHRTGSLIPPIIAHAVVNLPFNGPERPVVLAVAVVVAVVFWKPVARYSRDLWALLRSAQPTGWVLAGVLLVLAVALPLLALPESLVLWAVAGLVVAITLESREKRKATSS